jgi:hypothetical protein
MRFAPVLTVRNNLSALARVRRRHAKRYVITRTNNRCVQYYCMQLDGYRWTSVSDRATVFRGRDAVNNEIEATWMQYESPYQIVSL